VGWGGVGVGGLASRVGRGKGLGVGRRGRRRRRNTASRAASKDCQPGECTAQPCQHASKGSAARANLATGAASPLPPPRAGPADPAFASATSASRLSGSDVVTDSRPNRSALKLRSLRWRKEGEKRQAGSLSLSTGGAAAPKGWQEDRHGEGQGDCGVGGTFRDARLRGRQVDANGGWRWWAGRGRGFPQPAAPPHSKQRGGSQAKARRVVWATGTHLMSGSCDSSASSTTGAPPSPMAAAKGEPLGCGGAGPAAAKGGPPAGGRGGSRCTSVAGSYDT
jgi:hypothetical protein